jgi:hypothetical protein
VKTINTIDPTWAPCICEFQGCGNVLWLLRLPLNPKVPEVEIVLNHPWHEEPVALKYKGNYQKRQNVLKFVQVDPSPIYPKYTGGGHGLFV